MIDVYSGFVAHLLLEENVSDHVYSELSPWVAGASKRKEVEFFEPEIDTKGCQGDPSDVQYLFYTFLHQLSLDSKTSPQMVQALRVVKKGIAIGYTLNGQLDGIIAAVRAKQAKFQGFAHNNAEIKRLLSAFWAKYIKVGQGDLHFRGGYYNVQRGEGHAIGWTFTKDGLLLTNSGEGVQHHTTLSLDPLLPADPTPEDVRDVNYYETAVYRPWPKKTTPWDQFHEICSVIIDSHADHALANIDSVYDHQVPPFFASVASEICGLETLLSRAVLPHLLQQTCIKRRSSELGSTLPTSTWSVQDLGFT